MRKDDKNDHNLIEDFLDRKLSKQQDIEFQERLKTDKDFEQLYNFRMQIAEDWQKASEYEQARKQAKSLIKSIDKNKYRRLIIYAFAATLALLVIIPGVIFFNNRNNNYPGLAKNKEKDTIQSYTPQLKLPEEKTSIFYHDTVILVSPLNDLEIKNNDSIFFKWLPTLDSAETLVIENRIDNRIVFDKRIEKGLETFELEPEFLPVGEYYWQLKGLSAKDSFRIVR